MTRACRLLGYMHAHIHKPDCRQSLKTVIGYVEKDVPGELAGIGFCLGAFL